MVFQDYALYPHMTVRDNLAFGLKRHRVPRDEIPRRIERVTRMLGIDSLLRRKPHQLSGGQQQRVALGRAVVREPGTLPDGRAALEPRCPGPRQHACRAQGIAAPARRDDTLCDARPDRSHDARRPARRHERRPARAGRPPRSRSTARQRRSSSRNSSPRPRLNLLDGEIEGTGVRTAIALFPLPGLAGIVRRVRVGIRPEWLRLSPKPVADSTPLVVGLVEPLGAEMLVHARWSGGDLVARVAADALVPERGAVWIDAAASRVDLFDDAGRRLANEPAITV